MTNPAVVHIYDYLVQYTRRMMLDVSTDADRTLDVLDWGSGKGHITSLCQDHFPEARVVSCDVTGDDVADDSTFGQTTPLIERRGIDVVPLRDPIELPFDDASFDAVLSFGVLEHVANDVRSLSEIRRVLRPGGHLFCYFLPRRWSWTQWVERRRGCTYHDRLYDRHQVRAMLRMTGYDLVDLWHRQLLPKNSFRYPSTRAFERLDQTLVRWTPLRYLTTNLEFVARRACVPGTDGKLGEQSSQPETSARKAA